jgi:hypothetical protein
MATAEITTEKNKTPKTAVRNLIMTLLRGPAISPVAPVSIFHGLNGAIEELRNSILSHGRFLLVAKGCKDQPEAYSSRAERAKISKFVSSTLWAFAEKSWTFIVAGAFDPKTLPSAVVPFFLMLLFTNIPPGSLQGGSFALRAAWGTLPLNT